jgi:hypothetical protein
MDGIYCWWSRLAWLQRGLLALAVVDVAARLMGKPLPAQQGVWLCGLALAPVAEKFPAVRHD